MAGREDGLSLASSFQGLPSLALPEQHPPCPFAQPGCRRQAARWGSPSPPSPPAPCEGTEGARSRTPYSGQGFLRAQEPRQQTGLLGQRAG